MKTETKLKRPMGAYPPVIPWIKPDPEIHYTSDITKFSWGGIMNFHIVGDVVVIEYEQDNSNTFGSDRERLIREHGQRRFQPFIMTEVLEPTMQYGMLRDLTAKHSPNHSFRNIEDAIVFTTMLKRLGDINLVNHLMVGFQRMTLGVVPEEN